MAEKKKYTINQLLILRIAAVLGPALIITLGRLCRYKVIDQHLFDEAIKDGKGVVLTFWHGRMLLPIYHFKYRDITTLVSKHFDGEVITRIVLKLGYKVHRGSPKEAGREGFTSMLKDLKLGKVLAMFPNGPTGPMYSIRDGIIHLARMAGAPLLPVIISANPVWRTSGWDRFMFAKPFSRGLLRFGNPIYIPRRLKGVSEIEEYKKKIQHEMNTIERELDIMTGLEKE